MNLQCEIKTFYNFKQAFKNRGFEVEESIEDSLIISTPGYEGPNRDIDLFVLTMVHGDEIGGLVAANEFLKDLLENNIDFGGKVAVALGNRKAAEQSKRYLEYDMNRCFGEDSGSSWEAQRAKELCKIIDHSSYVIDIHQTAYPTRSDFFIFPKSPLNISFAGHLCDEAPIIVHGLDFSKDGLTSDIYASINGSVAITYEMGSIGICEKQVAKTKKNITNAYQLSNAAIKPKEQVRNLFELGQSVYSSEHRNLVPGFTNLSSIAKGQLLAEEKGNHIFAEHDGYLLFPKYGDSANQSAELCQLIMNVPVHSEMLYFDA